MNGLMQQTDYPNIYLIKTKQTMKYRVLLNTKTNYLHVTTSDTNSDELKELFACSSNINGADAPGIALNNCNIFCMAYIRGNTEVKANNSIKDFGF